jgi:hypothetical protein
VKATWRVVLGAVAVVVMAIAIFGIAQGQNEYQGAPEPTAAQVAQSRRQIAANPDAVAGEAVFTQEGCNRCHSLAAIGADGKLGPRMDAIDDEAAENAQYIASSQRGDDNIMPRDYGERMSRTELQQVSELIHSAYVEGIERDGD